MHFKKQHCTLSLHQIEPALQMTNYTVSIWAGNVRKHHVPAFDQLYPAYLANLSSIIAALHGRCGRITQHKGTCMNKHGLTSIAYAFVFVTPQQVMHFQRQAANIQDNNYNHKTQQVWKWPQWFMPGKLIAHRPAVLLLDDTKALWNSCWK